MRNISKEMSQVLGEPTVSTMKRRFLILFVVAASAALLYAPLASATSILGPNLATFAVLGATSVTNDYPNNTSAIFGNVGVWAGTSITGFTAPGLGVPTVDATGQVTGGLLHSNTTLAQNAQSELDTAIGTLNGMATTGPLLPDITGTYGPGVYDGGAGLLTGALNLIGSGNNSVWVFRFASSLTTGSGSSVSVTGVGDGANVGIYWVVGTGATLNGPSFAGNVLAQTLISSDGNLTVGCGRLLSATANVTLIGDTISIGCSGVASLSGGYDQGNPAAGGGGVIPEPGTLLLLGTGLAGLVAFRKRSKKA